MLSLSRVDVRHRRIGRAQIDADQIPALNFVFGFHAITLGRSVEINGNQLRKRSGGQQLLLTHPFDESGKALLDVYRGIVVQEFSCFGDVGIGN